MLSITLSVLVVLLSEVEVDGVGVHLGHVLEEAWSRWQPLIPQIHLDLWLGEGVSLRLLGLDFFHRCLDGLIGVKLDISGARLLQLLRGGVRFGSGRTIGLRILLPGFLCVFGAWDDDLGVQVGVGIVGNLVSRWRIINMMSPKKENKGKNDQKF